MWAIFGPAVGWSFIGTGLYAWRRRPESRIGALMVLLGFAWFLSASTLATRRCSTPSGLVLGGLWGGVFLHLVMSFPSGRLRPLGPRAGHRRLRRLPAGAPCRRCCSPAARPRLRRLPDQPAAVRHDADLATPPWASVALLYVVLFAIVLAWAVRRWRRTPPTRAPAAHAGLRLAPLTFLLVDRGPGRRGRRGAVGRVHRHRAAALRLPGRPAAQPPGAPRRRAAREPRGAARLARAARARPATPSAGAWSATSTTARRRGWSRSRSCSAARAGARTPPRRRRGDPDRRASTSSGPASPSCASWRAASTPRSSPTSGLEPALHALASRAPVPVTRRADGEQRLPARSRSPPTSSSPRRWRTSPSTPRQPRPRSRSAATNGRVTVDVTDDGIGGADAAQGSGLRGLGDRVAALDGTLSLDSPPGRRTRLHVELP